MQERGGLAYASRPRHRFWWLMPKPFDWLSSSLYIGIFVVAIVPGPPRIALWQIPLLVGIILALFLIDRLEYWRYGERVLLRAAVLLFTLRIAFFICIILLEGFNFTPFLFLIPPYLAVMYFGDRAGYVTAALAIAAYVTVVWGYQHDWYMNTISLFLVILYTFGVIFVVLMARVVRQEKGGRVRAEELLAEVERAHRQLQVYAERVAGLAATEERNRIAREIHDGLGHALIAITLQLEKALVYQEKEPGIALQAVSDANQVARDALQDVRRSVSVLRAPREPFACTQGILLLVEQLREHGLYVDFEADGSEGGFSNDALMTLYRVAQEGFTNIQKHAQASAVQVRLQFGEEEAQLSICDNGRGFDAERGSQPPESPSESYGLQGIRERLALVGGSFQLVSQEGSGTQLFATVTRTGIPATLRQDLLQQSEKA
jgi:signal transduction histidine kinase